MWPLEQYFIISDLLEQSLFLQTGTFICCHLLYFNSSLIMSVKFYLALLFYAYKDKNAVRYSTN